MRLPKNRSACAGSRFINDSASASTEAIGTHGEPSYTHSRMRRRSLRFWKLYRVPSLCLRLGSASGLR